jgi:DNA processing protein
MSILAQPLVAIVGSRNASAAGVKFAERWARELGQAGFGIVSELAGGQERIYPADHIDLLEKIVAEGAGIRKCP